MQNARFPLPVRISRTKDLVFPVKDICEYLRVDYESDSEEARVITGLINEARSICEAYTNKDLLPAEYELYLPAWWSGKLKIQAVPFISLTSISYYDASGVAQELGADSFRSVKLSNDLAAVVLIAANLPALQREQNGQPREDAVTIRFSVGFPTPGDIPEVLKNAMKLMIAAKYDRRADSADEKNRTAETLMDLERWEVIG